MNIESLIYSIEVHSKKDVIKVKPLQDLHKGAKSCDMKGFKQFIADPDPFTYYFLNGDMWDAIYFSDKRFMASGHEKTDKDDPIDEEIDEMADLLAPIKDRIIAVGIGNHEVTVLKKYHTNMSKRLAKKLSGDKPNSVPYMGFSYWIRMQLYRMDNGARGQVRTIDFFVQHGFGGGTRTEGGSITKYAKHADRFLCDVYVVGHDHRKQYVRYPTLALSGVKQVKLISKSKLIVLGGSWKKTYAQGTEISWEETKGFMPTEIGGVTINIKTTDDWVKMSVDM